MTSSALPPSRIALTAALATAVIGIAVLIGWAIDEPLLTSIVAGRRVMVPNSAVAFVVCGGAAEQLVRSGPTRRLSLALRAALVGVVCLSVATVFEYLAGRSFGVEYWLGFQYPAKSVEPFAGRMSLMTALCFVALAAALLSATRRASWAQAFADLAAASALLAGWLALLGFLFDARLLDDIPRFPGMALPTAIGFVLAGFSTLWRPSSPLRQAMATDSPGAQSMRRLLPAAIGIPVVLAVVNQVGVTSGWFGEALGIAGLALIFSILMSGVIAYNAAQLDRVDQERRVAEAALRASHAELDMRVAERTSELAAANARLQEQMHVTARWAEERAQLLERERDARRRAEHADRGKDEFLASVSHELRTPLNAMLGWLHLVRNGGLADDHGRQRALDVIERNALVQVKVVNDLLDLSRMTHGDLTLSRQPVDSAALVAKVLDSAGLAIAEKGLVVTADIENGDLTFADPDRLQQVVTNLLTNAVKFTPAGGEIRVQHRIDGGYMRLTVRDTGAGIAAHLLPHVFERFRRTDAGAAGRQSGLGLGLAIARSIVLQHGGEIRAESAGTGCGATFVVTLPLATGEMAAVAATDAASDGHNA